MNAATVIPPEKVEGLPEVCYDVIRFFTAMDLGTNWEELCVK